MPHYFGHGHIEVLQPTWPMLLHRSLVSERCKAPDACRPYPSKLSLVGRLAGKGV